MYRLQILRRRGSVEISSFASYEDAEDALSDVEHEEGTFDEAGMDMVASAIIAPDGLIQREGVYYPPSDWASLPEFGALFLIKVQPEDGRVSAMAHQMVELSRDGEDVLDCVRRAYLAAAAHLGGSAVLLKQGDLSQWFVKVMQAIGAEK